MASGLLAITPRSLEATAGDDWTHLRVTLWEDGAAKNVSAASSISAALMDSGGNAIISATDCSSGATGATWASGIVALPFLAASTDIGANEYVLEIQAVLSGAKRTWRTSLVVSESVIS